MFGRKSREQFKSIEDRFNRQCKEISSLKLELEAYRDHGIVFGQMYKRKYDDYIFKMNSDKYRDILCGRLLLDDFDRVTYKPVIDDEDTPVSVDVDTTDAEEEIAQLNRELIQARADLILEQSKTIKGLMHEAFGNEAEQPMNIVVVVSKPNEYCKDGIRLMTPEQVLGGECDGMHIDDYLLSSEVMHGDDITLLGEVDEFLSNAMMTSNRRL